MKNENFSKQNICSHTYSLARREISVQSSQGGNVICNWKLNVLKWKLLCYIYVGNTNCTDSNIKWNGSSLVTFVFKINSCCYKNADFLVQKKLVITPYTHEPNFSAWQAYNKKTIIICLLNTTTNKLTSNNSNNYVPFPCSSAKKLSCNAYLKKKLKNLISIFRN